MSASADPESRTPTDQPIERRYGLTALDRTGAHGGGKYVLYSNDLQHAYVIARYTETGDLSVEQADGTERVIRGTFWRALHIRPDSGLVSYEGVPGRSQITGVANDERLLDAVIDLAPSLVEIASLLKTRHAAIQVALRRYESRRLRSGMWAVYDRVSDSWPANAHGRSIFASTDRDRPESDADWLNRNHA